MRLPHVNSFFWIGLLLIGIAIYSFFKPAFQFDAGVPNERFESLIYLVVGVLMLVNGLIHPAPAVEENQDKSAPPAKNPSPKGQPATPGKTGSAASIKSESSAKSEAGQTPSAP